MPPTSQPNNLSLDEWFLQTLSRNKNNSSSSVENVLDVRLDVVDRPDLGTSANSQSLASPLNVVSIPLPELRQRSFELPPRQVSFCLVVGNEKEKEEASQFFFHKKKQQQKPWKIEAFVEASTTNSLLHEWELYRRKKERSIIGSKEGKKSPDTKRPRLEDSSASDQTSNHERVSRLPRLWQPDGMVQSVLLPALLDSLRRAHSTNQPYEIWDLGAGAGRDAAFLAEELSLQHRQHSFSVVAVDHRYRTDSHQKAVVEFFARRQASKCTKCKCLKLDNVDETFDHILRAKKAIVCFYAVRYWNRPLIERILQEADSVLPKGALIAISQFGKASEDALWPFEHPSEAHVLKRQELSELFTLTRGATSGSWKILHDDVVKDSDHGRTLIQFVARWSGGPEK